MSRKNIIQIISFTITILLSSFLPTFLSTYLNMDSTLIAILVTLILALILSIIYLCIEFSSKRTQSDQTIINNSSKIVISNIHNDLLKISNLHKLRIYAISTSNLLSYFQRETFFVDHCEILIRFTNDSHYCSESYKAEIEAKISLWKQLVVSGRIKHLTIIGYNNLPDNYFVIFDDILMFTDIVDFSSTDVSGQKMLIKPCWYSSKDDSQKEIIHRYINHFDNYINYYANSSTGKVFCNNYIRSE